MKFPWQVPQKTILLVVREDCKAIFDEYMNGVLVSLTSQKGWRAIADKS